MSEVTPETREAIREELLVLRHAALYKAEKAEEATEELRKKIAVISETLAELREYAPPVEEAKKARNKFLYELGGIGIAATGAWWVYPPAALLLVGGWMLAEVVAGRKAIKRKK